MANEQLDRYDPRATPPKGIQFYGFGDRPFGNDPGDVCAYGDGTYLATDDASETYLAGLGMVKVEGQQRLYRRAGQHVCGRCS